MAQLPNIDLLKKEISMVKNEIHRATIERDRLQRTSNKSCEENAMLVRQRTDLANELLKHRNNVLSAIQNANVALHGLSQREVEAEQQLETIKKEIQSKSNLIDKFNSKILATKAELFKTHTPDIHNSFSFL